MDHAVVVLAQERGRLRVAPFVGDRRDRVVGLQALVERAGRVAIGHGHATLELRHLDDAHRRIRHGDQVVLAGERGGDVERLPREVEHLVAGGAFGIGEFERRLDGSLLLRIVGCRRQRRGAVAVLQDVLRDGVHLASHARDIGLGALADLLARQRGVERVAQLLVEQLRTDAEVACGIRHQGAVDPGLVLLDRGAQTGYRGIQARACLAIEAVGVRSDELVHQRQQAAVLPCHGVRMHLRHPRRIEVVAHLREQRRQRFHARGRRGQAFRQRRELACHQVVDRATGQAVVEQRVPGP